MKRLTKRRAQLFEPDLAVILACGTGTSQSASRARGRRLWPLALVIPVIGGVMALHLREGTAPIKTPRVTSSEGGFQPRPLGSAPAETDRSSILATALVETPTVRTSIAKKDRRLARRLHSGDGEVMSDQAGEAKAYSAVTDAEEIEKVGTHDRNIEPELAPAPKQNLARLEAIDAIRSLRLR